MSAKSGLDPSSAKKMSSWLKTLVLLTAALALLLPVGLFGWLQFQSRATDPINKVKTRESPISGETIDKTILEFIREEDINIAENGFRPSWGAEEIEKDVWIVSYVFEVGRKATWISWEVDMNSGNIIPKDDTADALLNGQ
ncbi:MAG: hypothetical protein JW738_04640 [Actinobacteria bacterium]|nr:hypothetical protein [Actinomycetota bacterium]